MICGHFTCRPPSAQRARSSPLHSLISPSSDSTMAVTRSRPQDHPDILFSHPSSTTSSTSAEGSSPATSSYTSSSTSLDSDHEMGDRWEGAEARDGADSTAPSTPHVARLSKRSELFSGYLGNDKELIPRRGFDPEPERAGNQAECQRSRPGARIRPRRLVVARSRETQGAPHAKELPHRKRPFIRPSMRSDRRSSTSRVRHVLPRACSIVARASPLSIHSCAFLSLRICRCQLLSLLAELLAREEDLICDVPLPPRAAKSRAQELIQIDATRRSSEKDTSCQRSGSQTAARSQGEQERDAASTNAY